MRPDTPDVSVIVVSWNTRELLLKALASMPAALGGLQAEVWVVDNGSTDGSAEAVARRYPRAHVIANQHNLGFAAANNQAIAAGSGRYLLLLNSDTEACPDSIERLVRFADAHPTAGIVGPMLLNSDGSFQASFASFPSWHSELLSVTGVGRRLHHPAYPSAGPRQSQVARSVDYVGGACMLVRRAAVLSAGPMDEHFFMYAEEIDWCLRLRQAGWPAWYLPDARVVHHGGQSTRQRRDEMIRMLYRSKIRYFRKHHGTISATIVKLMFVVALRTRWLARAPWAASRERTVTWADLSSPPA